MGNAFIGLGAFTLFMSIMLTSVFLTTPKNSTIERLIESFRIKLRKSTVPEFGISILKLTGILWMVLGIVLKFTGEAFLQGIVGDIVIITVILTPVWVGVILAESRKGKRL